MAEVDAARPVAAETGGGPPGPGRLRLAGAYLLVVVVSFVVSLYAGFLAPAGPRIGSFLISYGFLVALVAPGAAAWVGHLATGTRLGALVPLFVWIVMTVVVLGQKTAAGDIILTGRVRDYLVILAGILSSTVVAAVVRPWRGLTALPGTEPPR